MTTRREFLVGLAVMPLLGYVAPKSLPITTFRIDLYDGRYIEIIDIGREYLVNFNGEMAKVDQCVSIDWLFASTQEGDIVFRRAGDEECPAIDIRSVMFYSPLFYSQPNWNVS